ncbi:2-oxoadipate dioxygenase/decarboxylase family protein [Phenylobacterium montanum]|uniref:2-oxoadipate dioxygenase/decarboxylase n=1 Tax=Phenylobacterium montanum TaxID=2823693 RepID=A0A975G4P4_9CAUL|nr:DUF1338 family protein [Caulobacter sp. S6]QUD90477.1 DUF1338 family protein [Caulobacter sp. S6]
MIKPSKTVLVRLLSAVVTERSPAELFAMTAIRPEIAEAVGEDAPRAIVAQAMNLALLDDLLGRVPTARAYVEDLVAEGRQLVFDHGALRTVDLAGMGALPAGRAAIARVLEPLGYDMTAVYPLDRLGMTGRSYTHIDFPEDLPQFFVSELHPKRFSPAFQAAVARVTATSKDPLSAEDLRRLAELSARGALPVAEAAALLPKLLACFSRRHSTPCLADYETLRAESAEMAWIATEGNAFNHATDRVENLDEVVERQRTLKRPLKDKIEVSRSGRVKQTAFKADVVERDFLDAEGRLLHRDCPGSFFEFIERDVAPDAGRLDLGFDSGNAQGIFKMTAAA